MIVLQHPQSFTNTPRGKTQIQSSFCHPQAVSQLEFGSIDATVEEKSIDLLQLQRKGFR